MFLVLCCDVCNNFRIKTITLLPPVVCRQAHVLYVLFDFVVYSGVLYDLYVSIGVTWRVSYKKQELLTPRNTWIHHQLYGGIRVALPYGFLCCVIFILLTRVLCVQVSLDWQFLIAPPVFSNVYLHVIYYPTCISRQ